MQAHTVDDTGLNDDVLLYAFSLKEVCIFRKKRLIRVQHHTRHVFNDHGTESAFSFVSG